MNFALTLYWNGKAVAHCVCTSAVAYEMARAHIVGNIGPVPEDAIPSIDAIRSLSIDGHTIADAFGDTIRAGFAISRISR